MNMKKSKKKTNKNIDKKKHKQNKMKTNILAYNDICFVLSAADSNTWSNTDRLEGEWKYVRNSCEYDVHQEVETKAEVYGIEAHIFIHVGPCTVLRNQTKPRGLQAGLKKAISKHKPKNVDNEHEKRQKRKQKQMQMLTTKEHK